jgi:hypothetical protein
MIIITKIKVCKKIKFKYELNTLFILDKNIIKNTGKIAKEFYIK